MSDFRSQVQTITIAQSETVSTAAAIKGYTAIGFQLPILTSTTLTAEVGADASSASFVPLAGFSLSTETGSKATSIADVELFPFVRVRSSVAQAADSHFLVYGKRNV